MSTRAPVLVMLSIGARQCLFDACPTVLLVFYSPGERMPSTGSCLSDLNGPRFEDTDRGKENGS